MNIHPWRDGLWVVTVNGTIASRRLSREQAEALQRRLLASAHDAWFGDQRLQRQARLWFFSDSDAVGSCVWICQILDVDINAVRQRVGR